MAWTLTNTRKLIWYVLLKRVSDINLTKFGLEVIWNINDNWNNPFVTALWEGNWSIEDTDGNVLVSSVPYANSIANATLADYTVEAWASETFVVVMPQAASIKSEFYEAVEKTATFNYVDDEWAQSPAVDATYNK